MPAHRVFGCIVSQPFQPHLNGCAVAIIFTNAKKYMRWKCFWQYPDLIIASFVTFNHIVYFLFLFVSSNMTTIFLSLVLLSSLLLLLWLLFLETMFFKSENGLGEKESSLPSYKIQQFSTAFYCFVRSYERRIRLAQGVDFSFPFLQAHSIYISYSQLYTFYVNTFLSSSWITREKKNKKRDRERK